MPVFLVLVVGAAAGILGSHFMKLNVNIYLACAIGVLGTIVGGFALRGLMNVMLSTTGVLSLFLGAIFGVVVLIWIYRTYFSGR
ncbi:hypothetical protein GCM10008927_23070 [Amylibacter ulvae]|uniref:GlsB/YeaQ/YmgE family stress response membrane protein n=1 Tax=Paramylibacter ulvae TaxID=1651968 RepID=A0ABQ3D4T0_9RHOB|nr:GlsB/YeaQ/YmgE family stress response membrane protein [Amylibacter ulvae]GHA56646.1 hypothetical protein GCM10008927_23070 [Amylibacter ulvae]